MTIIPAATRMGSNCHVGWLLGCDRTRPGISQMEDRRCRNSTSAASGPWVTPTASKMAERHPERDHQTCKGEFLKMNLKPKNPHHCQPAYHITYSFSKAIKGRRSAPR